MSVSQGQRRTDLDVDTHLFGVDRGSLIENGFEQCNSILESLSAHLGRSMQDAVHLGPVIAGRPTQSQRAAAQGSAYSEIYWKPKILAVLW